MQATLATPSLLSAATILLLLSGSMASATGSPGPASATEAPRPGRAPSLAFVFEERTDRIVVAAAESSADWSDLGIRFSSPSADVALNVGDPDAGAPGVLIDESPRVADERNDVPRDGLLPLAPSPLRVMAGDFVELCASASASDVTATLVDSGGARISGFTWHAIRSCDDSAPADSRAPSPSGFRSMPRATEFLLFTWVSCGLWVPSAEPGAVVWPAGEFGPVEAAALECEGDPYPSGGSYEMKLEPGHHDCFHPLSLPPVLPLFGERPDTVLPTREPPAPFTTPPRPAVREGRMWIRPSDAAQGWV